MELELRKLEGNEMEFILSGATPAFANAIRRTAMREVPVMAIDEVDFKMNESAMYDEVLAHRLAMIPLHTPPKGYIMPSECDCPDGRCPKCSVSLTLDREGPTTAMSGDLKSSDEDVTPVSDSVPIVKLEAGQRLEFTAIAHLGLGKEHAKWQPGIIAYKYARDDPTRFTFTIESTGALPPEQILIKAIGVLEDKCKEFSKRAKKL